MEFENILKEFPVLPRISTRVCSSRLESIRPVRVILFDIYDTLVSSPKGDLESQLTDSREEVYSFIATARMFGFSEEVGRIWSNMFFAKIEEEQRFCHSLGITRAEVLVERIWHDLLLAVGGSPDVLSPYHLALYREMVANPVALFEGVDVILTILKERGFCLGLASNSQFYTLPILSRLLGRDIDTLFDPRWCFLSYKLGFAKPDPHFFRLVRIQALRCGLEPREVVMIGNDLENDIQAAIMHGLQAVHFLAQGISQGISPSSKVVRIRNLKSLLNLKLS